MRTFADGLGLDADLLVAAEAAAQQAIVGLDGQSPDLVCTFVSGGDPDQVAAAGERVADLMQGGAMIGCSADGVIGRARGIEGRAAVSVWAGVLPGARIRSFHLEVMPAEAGVAVIGMPERYVDDHVALLLADAYSFPADGFVSRANTAVAGLPIVGGLAAGARGAGSTRLWLDGRTVERGAVGVVLGGDVPVKALVSQGCRPIGPAMTVTAAQGNVIHELAGTPAIDKLERLLAELPPLEQAIASRGLQIGIALDEYVDDHDRGDFLVRGILGADPDSSGLVVGDLVEVGCTVRLQVRDADAADEDLHQLLAGFRHENDAQVGGALLFSCNGRGSHMFGASLGGADHDVTVVRQELATTGVAGFFAGGELGPVGGRNHLHGFTASVLAFPA